MLARRSIQSRPFQCLIGICLCLCATLGLGSDSDPRPLRIMSVVIVQQDGFLQYLLEPYLKEHPIEIDYRTGHHRDVVQAVRNHEVDLVFVHTKINAMHKLESEGLLAPGTAIIANPKAFLGPKGDPAKLNGVTDPLTAMQQIQASGHCFVINPHGPLEVLQRSYLAELNNPCVIETATNTDEALDAAATNRGFTLWGLHPYLAKGAGRLEPHVTGHPDLLQNIGVWVVRGTPAEPAAQGMADYLKSDPIKARIRDFRLINFPDDRAWFEAVH